MPQKCPGGLIFFNAGSVVRDADQRDPAVFDLDRDRRCPGVYGIFYKLFYNGRRTLDYLSRRDFIDGFLA